MTYSIKNHALLLDGKPVKQLRTPNMSAGVLKPSLLVMHYTAGFTAASAVSTLMSPAAKASAHFVIDRDGTVTQLAPLNKITWHAGQSIWKGRQFCNSFSIGIELVNCGPLLKRADGKIVAEVAPKKIIPAADAVEAIHPNGERTRYWQLYPEEQMEAAIGVARAICKEYGIKDITGHYDIAPKRKRDPGPAFNMIHFRSAVFGRSDDAEEVVVQVPAAGPGNITEVIEKPRSEVTAADLLAGGSRTIKAAGTVKRAVVTGATAVAATAGSVATEPDSALEQVQTAAQSVSQTASAVSTAKDSVSALSDIGSWFSDHWIVVVAAVAGASVLWSLYVAWRAAQIVEQARVDDARSGANIGRL